MTKDTKDTISPHKKSPSPITTLVADPPPPSKHRSSPKSFSPSTLPPIIYEDPITKILEAENELRKAEENGDTKLEKVDLSELLEKDLQERTKDNTNTVDDTANCKAGSTAIVGNSIVQDMSRSTSFDTDYDNIQRLPSVADTTQNVSEQKNDTSELPTTEEPNDTVRKEIFAAMVEEEKLMMMNQSTPTNEQKDTDLESQPLDNKSNNGILQDANVRPTSPTNQGLPEVEAYLVDKDDVVIATPTKPWYKQKRTVGLVGLVFVLLAAMAIALGVSLSSSSNNNESNENISSSNTALTEEGVVTTTSSSSIAPSSSTFSVFVPVSESVAPSPPSLATELLSDSQAPTPAPCYDINIAIKYDGYPAETSFQLYKVDIDGSKEIIKSHSAKDGDTFYNETMCLQEGMYAYTMFDADGICCSYGNGSYNITDADGTLIVEGGEFKQVEMTKFSLGYVTDSPPPAEEEVVPPDDQDECYQVEIAIEYDGYPAETSWELHRIVYDGEEDELVDSHSGSSGDTSFNETLCLPEGEYNFTIINADGICCSYGQGSYNITTPNGGVFAEGGEFTGSESSIFVFPFDRV